MRDLALKNVEDFAAIVMRFRLSHPVVSTVIPGMRSTGGVEGNVMASGQGPLPESTLALVRLHAWVRNFLR